MTSESLILGSFCRYQCARNRLLSHIISLEYNRKGYFFAFLLHKGQTALLEAQAAREYTR